MALGLILEWRVGFAKSNDDSIGTEIFTLLYPSVAAVAMEFQSLQNLVLLLKFNQDSDC